MHLVDELRQEFLENIFQKTLQMSDFRHVVYKNESNQDLNLVWGSPYQVTKNSTCVMKCHRDSRFPCGSLDKSFAHRHFKVSSLNMLSIFTLFALMFMTLLRNHTAIKGRGR